MSATNDVSDAAVVELAVNGDEILTGDFDDITRLTRAARKDIVVTPI